MPNAPDGNSADVDVITSAGADSLTEAAARRRRLAEIDLEVKEHSAAVKTLARERTTLEERVLDDFAELGTDSMRTELDDGKRTVYLEHPLYAGAPKTGTDDKNRPVSTDDDWAAACDAVREAGLDYMLGERFNAQTLSSWLREFRKEHGIGWRDKLPEPLGDVLRIDDRPRIKTRKA